MSQSVQNEVKIGLSTRIACSLIHIEMRGHSVHFSSVLCHQPTFLEARNAIQPRRNDFIPETILSNNVHNECIQGSRQLLQHAASYHDAAFQAYHACIPRLL